MHTDGQGWDLKRYQKALLNMEKIYKVGKQGKLLRVRLQILVVTWKNGK